MPITLLLATPDFSDLPKYGPELYLSLNVRPEILILLNGLDTYNNT